VPAPSDETDAELVALNIHQLLFEIRLAAKNARIAPADDSQPTGARHGGRQTTTGNERHRGANDWVLDSERVSQPRSHVDLLHQIARLQCHSIDLNVTVVGPNGSRSHG
jgi:hypothetical protein